MILFALERFMLTPRHRALFEASYSALLLRTDPGDRHPPVPVPTPSQVHEHNVINGKDFHPGSAG
jgi:hypothetical protein